MIRGSVPVMMTTMMITHGFVPVMMMMIMHGCVADPVLQARIIGIQRKSNLLGCLGRFLVHSPAVPYPCMMANFLACYRQSLC